MRYPKRNGNSRRAWPPPARLFCGGGGQKPRGESINMAAVMDSHVNAHHKHESSLARPTHGAMGRTGGAALTSPRKLAMMGMSGAGAGLAARGQMGMGAMGMGMGRTHRKDERMRMGMWMGMEMGTGMVMRMRMGMAQKTRSRKRQSAGPYRGYIHVIHSDTALYPKQPLSPWS